MRIKAALAVLALALPARAAGGFELTSPAVNKGGALAVRFTAQGANVSPPLRWTGAPAGTQAFALIVTDSDAPSGTFTHWVCANIPGPAHDLPEGAGRSTALVQGRNDFGKDGYGGPDPPRGKVHHYHFALLALSRPLLLPSHCTRYKLLQLIHPVLLGKAELTAVYRR